MEAAREYIRNIQPHLLHAQLAKEPSLVLKADGDGRSLLMSALSDSQNTEVVSEVLRTARDQPKFDIDAGDEAGFTALHIAASLGAVYVELLLPFRPAVDALTNGRQTPLFLAVSKNQTEAVKLLLDAGARPAAKDSRQVTPVMRAAAMGSSAILELLLHRKPPVNATDVDGWTALHYAFAEERLNACEILLQHGADDTRQTSDGETPSQLSSPDFAKKVKARNHSHS